MATTDAELEQQLKDAGKQLSHPPDSVDELLPVLDKVEKLLVKVDQSPKKSMIDALRPSMSALIQDGLSKHSDIDVKVAVASCISEITRITAPDAPYADDQMRDVFQLIVSSFEDLADQSSRSYNKRASILETVSKVRSCVIMLDLECDELIVKMFVHFLKSVRDYHLDIIFSSMENIMVLVIEESEEISIEMLKPLLASVKKDSVGVLPVAHKLGKAVLLKSADKLQPYMRPALTTLGETLDMYHKVVAAVCEGTTANFNNNDDNDSGLQLVNDCKLEQGSVDEAHQVDESKHTTASSDHTDEVAKKKVCQEVEVDPTVENKSLKSVMSNGVNVTVKEEASDDQKSRKPEEDKIQEPLSKEDTEDSDTEVLVKEKSETEKTSKTSEKKVDTIASSTEPSDSYHVVSDKEIEKDNDVKETETENERDTVLKELENKTEKDNVAKESAIKAAISSETEKDEDVVQGLSPNVIESGPAATANVSSPSQANNASDESSDRSKKKPVPQEDEIASPSKSGSSPDETHVKNLDLPKIKGLTQEDTPKAQKQAGNKVVIAKEFRLQDTVKKSEDGKTSSDSDAKPLKKSIKSIKQKLPDTVKKYEDGEAGSDSDAKPLKMSSKSTKQKHLDTVQKPEDGEASGDSDAKPLKQSSKSTKQSGKKSKQPGKKLDVESADAKKPKQSGKKIDVKDEDSDSDAKPLKMKKPKQSSKKVDVKGEDSDSDAKPLKMKKSKQSGKKVDVKDEDRDSDAKPLKMKKPKQSGKKVDVKDEDSDSDAKPLKMSAKKGGKNKINVEEAQEHDSDNKPLKQSAKKSTTNKKDDGTKRGNVKNVAEKDQAKSLSGDDEMDVSPKSAMKSAKGEGNSTEIPVTGAKRKHFTDQDKDAIKYDESLVGTKIKVWWPEDKAFYEGVVAEYFPAKKKHKISYVDGDEERLNLRSQRWEILQEFSVGDNEEHNAEAQREEASPEIHKKKKSKTDPAMSQEKIKDSSKRVGGVSSSGKSKGSIPKEDKSTQKRSGKSYEAAAATSKETGKSKEDEETPKTSSKTKTVNKSKGKTPPSGSKSNTNTKSVSSNTKEAEDVKSTEKTKGGSKSGNKRKKRT